MKSVQEAIAELFAGWEETMIWSCLEGHMGHVYTDGRQPPRSARIEVGDFCFFGGEPNLALVRAARAPILAPQTPAWSRMIEEVWTGALRHTRYATQKDPDVFDRARLTRFASSLPGEYELQPIGRELYAALLRESWSADLVVQFTDFEDYQRRGIGFAATHCGIPVAGASSYTIYTGGIEIEIDTRQDYRKQGLATACGAQLILECLERGLYPSWDAHDLRSLALAQKLGYRPSHPYPVYFSPNAPR